MRKQKTIVKRDAEFYAVVRLLYLETVTSILDLQTRLL